MLRPPSTRRPPPWLLAQRWENVLFAHWPVEPTDVREQLPPGVEPDTRDGAAWIGIVAFVMAGSRSCGPPWWPVLAPIPELNVRTYVRFGGARAVWFLSLDASSAFFAALGRALYGLRYHIAEMTVVERDGTIAYRSDRPGAAFAAAYRPVGPAEHAERGSLEHFLVERYRLFAERRRSLVTAEVAHEPWPLQSAEAYISANGVAPRGLALEGEPLLHFSRGVAAVISAPMRAGSVLGDEGHRRRLRGSRRGRSGHLVGAAGRGHVPADTR